MWCTLSKRDDPVYRVKSDKPELMRCTNRMRCDVTTDHRKSEDGAVDTTGSQELTQNSQSTMYLRVTHLVSDLHRRASFDTPALLRELIERAAESVRALGYSGVAGLRPAETRRNETAAPATHRLRLILDKSRVAVADEGPCLTAATLQRSVHIDDLAGDDGGRSSVTRRSSGRPSDGSFVRNVQGGRRGRST